jgi:glycosyltransferase involved in cell wall biosynthesis
MAALGRPSAETTRSLAGTRFGNGWATMRIAIIAPPFIPVPPINYGGTELFIAQLARGLTARGHRVVVYANGESRLPCEVRWLYETSDWPLADPANGTLKQLTHTAWAMRDLSGGFDVVHLNDAMATFFTPFVSVPAVKTLHHPHEPALTELYRRHPQITYVAISSYQYRAEQLPRMRTIPHGIPTEHYRFEPRKQDYLAFLGRIAPMKGTHLAIEVARASGLPLKIAGEIQPIFRGYWDQEIAPHVDGRQIEYVGEVGFEAKNELLANARALLFPIQWDEPFGLVMIEAMACGTPVLALPGGSVHEVVEDGVTGYVCSDAADMAQRAARLAIDPLRCRRRAETRFHVDLMVRRYEALFLELARSRRTGALPRLADGHGVGSVPGARPPVPHA